MRVILTVYGLLCLDEIEVGVEIDVEVMTFWACGVGFAEGWQGFASETVSFFLSSSSSVYIQIYTWLYHVARLVCIGQLTTQVDFFSL